MQIDLVKYMSAFRNFAKELDDVLNTKIPEGYIEVNAKKRKKSQKARSQNYNDLINIFGYVPGKNQKK